MSLSLDFSRDLSRDLSCLERETDLFLSLLLLDAIFRLPVYWSVDEYRPTEEFLVNLSLDKRTRYNSPFFKEKSVKTAGSPCIIFCLFMF